MRHRRGVTVVWLGLVVGLTGGLALGEEPRPAVTEKISVTQVEIAVQVLRRGESVRGLGAEDFEVLDRGERQEIVSFEVVDLSPTDELAATAAGGRAEEDRDQRRRHLLILIDLDLTDWKYLPRALDGARVMVSEQLHPSDRLAIGFYSSVYGPQLLHGFLEDREASLVALDVVEAIVDREPDRAGRELAELARLTGLRLDGEEVDAASWRGVARQWSKAILRPLGGPSDAAPSVGGRPDDDPILDRVRSRLTSTPSSADEPIMRRLRQLGHGLRDLARDLAAVPEPKRILLLSEGFPSRFLETGDHAARAIFRLDVALKAFLETGWVLEAVDVRGIPSIDRRGFDGNGLFHLAHHSGGRVYENFNRIEKATEKIVQRSSVTYLLVIQPNIEVDGSFHDLEVRLPGVRRAELSYRPGYRAPRRADRPRDLDDRLDVAELILADREFRDFEVELIALPVPSAGGRARVPVLIEIPGRSLLENPFGGVASIEVHAYGLDRFGGVQDLFIRRVDVDLARDGRRLDRGGLRLTGRLAMSPGVGEIRVLVRNLADDALSLVGTPIEVGGLEEADLAVLPPLFVDRSRDWLSLDLSPATDEADGEGVDALASLGSAFFPHLAPAIRGDREQQLVFHLFYSTAEAPVVQLRLLSARGEELEPPRVRFLERWVGPGGGTGLVAVWKPKGLSPGGYTLEIALVDRATGRRATGATDFKIIEPS